MLNIFVLKCIVMYTYMWLYVGIYVVQVMNLDINMYTMGI